MINNLNDTEDQNEYANKTGSYCIKQNRASYDYLTAYIEVCLS